MKNIIKILTAIFGILSGIALICLDISIMANYSNSDADIIAKRIILIIIGVVIIITSILILLFEKEICFITIICACGYYRFFDTIAIVKVPTVTNLMIAILMLVAIIAIVYSLFNFKYKLVGRFIGCVLLGLSYLYILIDFIANSVSLYVTICSVFYILFFVLTTITYLLFSIKYYIDAKYGIEENTNDSKE